MEVSFNPGHAEGLKKVGILRDDEHEIEQVELVKRTLEKGKAQEVLQALSEQVSTSYNNITLLKFLLPKYINAAKENPTDKDKRIEITNRRDAMGQILTDSPIQITLASTIAHEIDSQIVRTEESEGLLSKIDTHRQKAVDHLGENGDKYVEYFAELNSLTQNW